MTDGWDALRTELARVLAELHADEFLVLGEPAAEPGPRQGLLRRRPPPPPTRYVQFRRDDDTLYAECVGATLFGGDWAVDPGTHDRLGELGWLAPGDGDGAPAYPNYWCRRPRAETAALAAMATGALRLLGADVSGLQWQRDR